MFSFGEVGLKGGDVPEKDGESARRVEPLNETWEYGGSGDAGGKFVGKRRSGRVAVVVIFGGETRMVGAEEGNKLWES